MLEKRFQEAAECDKLHIYSEFLEFLDREYKLRLSELELEFLLKYCIKNIKIMDDEQEKIICIGNGHSKASIAIFKLNRLSKRLNEKIQNIEKEIKT